MYPGVKATESDAGGAGELHYNGKVDHTVRLDKDWRRMRSSRYHSRDKSHVLLSDPGWGSAASGAS